MRFTGTHKTVYTYSEPVFLQPHKIRLRPRSDPGQYLRDWGMTIDPVPASVTESLDAWGNNVSWAWFTGEHDHLEVSTRFVVDRLRVNPFDFMIPTAEGAALPPVYPADEQAALDTYFHVDAGPRVRALADEIVHASNGNVVDFATRLADRLSARCETIVRIGGPPLSSEDTLASNEGSCRDLAVVYVEACRSVGIASRFVSGYVELRMPGEPRDLHAWAGVYVPGAGWRGYDPTQGLAVSTGHVVLATAARSDGAAPVTGSYSGGARAELHSEIDFDVTEIT
ncbi:MAG: transglutaminase family protein [Actinomycetota bacterium]